MLLNREPLAANRYKEEQFELVKLGSLKVLSGATGPSVLCIYLDVSMIWPIIYVKVQKVSGCVISVGFKHDHILVTRRFCTCRYQEINH